MRSCFKHLNLKPPFVTHLRRTSVPPVPAELVQCSCTHMLKLWNSQVLN